MKQDAILREKFGRDNYFRVPEGYFDDFAGRMMDMLPETAGNAVVDKKRIPVRVKRLLWLAAMFCGLFLCVTAVRFAATRSNGGEQKQAAAEQIKQDEYIDRYVDDMCDFAGIGSEQIYAYITDDPNY